MVSRPGPVLELIYRFLGEPAFAHDFENVEYSADAFDAQLGVRGLHTVRKKVAVEDRKTVLPPDLVKKYAGDAFWRSLDGSAAHVITAKADVPAPDPIVPDTGMA